MADEKATEVTEVNTDLASEDNPFDSNGYIGVDPYFQGAPIEKPKEEKPAEAEKKPAAPVNPVTPPK